MAAPKNYDDPYWTQLALNTEQKLDLPQGLLVNVLTKGERSNADQVSEAGARTPFQIIPQTRKAAIDKYGIDPYLSPENAAEVSGKLLKDSLARNKGNQALAVAEYHGGTNKENWGPKTKAYVKRVVGISPDNPAATQGESTFDRVSRQMGGIGQPTESAIANIYTAYQQGKLDPEEKKQFEQDIKSGAIVLPQRLSIGTDTLTGGTVPLKPGAQEIPQAVFDAYANGTMAEKDRAELEADAQAGIISFPKTISPSKSLSSQIPGQGTPEQEAAFKAQQAQQIATIASTPKPADPTLVDKIIGGGETALTLATGATSGTAGALGGFVEGVAQGGSLDDIGKNMEKRAGQLTFAPRTQSGQEQTQAVGKVMEQVAPVTPLTAEMGMIGRSAAMAGNAAKTAAAGAISGAASKVRAASPAIVERVQRTLSRNPEPVATPGTKGSVGAAGVDMADQRTALAKDLPVPIKISRGQATRDPDQLRFEQETAKGEQGAKIRDFNAEQNAGLQKNFEAWIDQTGKTTSDAMETGKVVDNVLRKELERDKAEVNVKYKAADKSPEALKPVDPGESVSIGQGDNAIDHSVISYLNSKPSGLSTTALTDHAKQYAVKLGVAELAEDGSLIAKPTNVKTMEALRKEISQATGYEPTAKRDSAILKGLIDAQTEPIAGPLYREARRSRENLAKKWENRSVIDDLVSNKRGMDDRKVAVEDVFKHIVLDGDRSDLSHMRRVLQTGGEEGKQAWKELQGETVQWIRDEALKNVATDQRGNRIVSAAQLDKAITKLDKNGKLEFMFGKQGAQQMRDLNDLAKVVMTTPPGTVNTSNTASVLLAALSEAGVTGSLTGLPVPVLSALRLVAVQVKNRKIQKRIDDALANRPTSAPVRTPAHDNRTLH